MTTTTNLIIHGASPAASALPQNTGDQASSPSRVAVPAPHDQHRVDLPVEPLPEVAACSAEPVWHGAARMLHRFTSARRLHPAGSGRI